MRKEGHNLYSSPFAVKLKLLRTYEIFQTHSTQGTGGKT